MKTNFPSLKSARRSATFSAQFAMSWVTTICVSPSWRCILRIRSVMVFAINNDPAPVRLEKSDGKRESNRLSRAARPKDCERLALFHTKGNAVEHFSIIKRLVDIDEFDEIGHEGIVDSVNHENHSIPVI